MKIRPVGIIFIILLLMLAAASAAKADGIAGDGTVRVAHGSDPSTSMSCSENGFKIKLNGNGAGIANCINTSGIDWIGLDIFAVIPVNSSLTINQEVNCVTFFASCTPTVVKLIGNSGKEEVKIELLGGLITAGSASDVCTGTNPAPSCFFINLEMNTSGGWFGLSGARDGTVDVSVLTPEPGTLLLLLSGAGALSFRRRRTLLA